MFDDAAALLQAIGVLRRQGHEIIVFQLWDRDELDFPFGNWARFENLENDEDFLLLDPAAIRQRYLPVLEEVARRHCSTACASTRWIWSRIVTDEPHTEALRKYLALRMRR